MAKWSQTGFFDRATSIMDDVIAEPGYFRATFHTRRYIEREWARYFRIVDFLPGWIGHQDLVVLRKE